MLEVHPCRHHCDPLLAHGIPQLTDLFTMQEQLARAAWVVVEELAGLFVRGDVGVYQPGFLAIYPT